MSSQPLRICFLTYRGNPHCGGQGIYTRHLTRELAALGHTVDVWSGPPYPALDPGVGLRTLPSLDLWNEEHLLRPASYRQLADPIHRAEWLRTLSGEFPEMHTFSRRVLRAYRNLSPDQRYDVVHDNQCLGDALPALDARVPVVATIHHAMTVDRDLALAAAKGWKQRWGLRRWYSFIPEQVRVARGLRHVLTVSEAAGDEIAEAFELDRGRIDVVPNGVDTDHFRPLPEVERRPDRLITTLSADVPLKGFRFLLEAVGVLRRERPSLTLTVVGKNGKRRTLKRIQDLGLGGSVSFTGRLSDGDLVRTYAESTIAVVPSLYEGFGLPAAEAMACQVPVVSTTAGALPEVVGTDGTAGVLVPPGESESLARPIGDLLDRPERRVEMGEAGRRRVEQYFTWRTAAERVAGIYATAIAERERRC